MGIDIKYLNVANEAINDFLQVIQEDDRKLRSDLEQVQSSLNSLKNADMFSIMTHARTLESSLEEVFKRIGDADCNIDAQSRSFFSMKIKFVLFSNNSNGILSLFKNRIEVLRGHIKAAEENAHNKIIGLETKGDGIVPDDSWESLLLSLSSSVDFEEDAVLLAANGDEDWEDLGQTAEQNIAERTQATVQFAWQMLEREEESDYLSTENYTDLLEAQREVQSCWGEVDMHVEKYRNPSYPASTAERQTQRALGEQAEKIKNENSSLLEDLGNASADWLKKWSDELQSEKNQLIALLKKNVHELCSQELTRITFLHQRVMNKVDQAKALSKNSGEGCNYSLYTEAFSSVAGWNTEVEEAKQYSWLLQMSAWVTSLCNNEDDKALDAASVAAKLPAVTLMQDKIDKMPEALRKEQWVTALKSRAESLKNLQSDLQAQKKHANQQCQAIDPRSKATDKATPAAQPKAVSRLRYWWQHNRLFLALWLVVTGSAVIGALLSATAVAPALASAGIASVTVLGVSFPPILLGVAALALGVFAISQIAYFKGKPWGTALELKLGWQAANPGQKAGSVASATRQPSEKSSPSLNVTATQNQGQGTQQAQAAQTSTIKGAAEPFDQSSGPNP